MSEIEEVQEQMKVDMETMKDQMTSMMEAMLSMKRITGECEFDDFKHDGPVV